MTTAVNRVITNTDEAVDRLLCPQVLFLSVCTLTPFTFACWRAKTPHSVCEFIVGVNLRVATDKMHLWLSEVPLLCNIKAKVKHWGCPIKATVTSWLNIS